MLSPNLIFVLTLALLLGGLYAWGFRNLASEQWQFIGTIPILKKQDRKWQGLNLTYYGLFNANAVTLAVLMAYVLLGASGFSIPLITLIIVATFIPCIPAAKLMALWVEKKAHTFSIGGASFVGFLSTPWILILCNYFLELKGEPTFPIMPALAAISVAYALGEGSGRLACISFGCCYGKPIAQLPVPWQRILGPISITFQGHTKKIAYADNLTECPVVPIQAITTLLYSAAGIAGCLLFLQGQYHWAFILCVWVTQIWRFLSEFLRADFRGSRKISAYQIMALFVCLYAGGVFLALPSDALPADIIKGLHQLWNPSIILICQILWIGIFLYLGRSQVTGSRIVFHVRKKRI